MRKKIFLSTFFASLSVCLASIIIILGALYSYYSEQYDGSIRETAGYLASGVNYAGPQFLKNCTYEGKDRVTLISENGQVLYDNVMRPEQMENHSNREEFVKAKSDGIGEVRRYSSTLSEKTYYYAVLLNDGSVLRVSGTQYTVLSLVLNMIQPLLIVVLVAVLLSYALASVISKRIVKPINEIDIDNPSHIEGYEELTPLTDNLIRQKKQIDYQMRQLKDEHESQDKMRREFTANVSHELKTPLTSISGFAEIMRDGLVKIEDVPRFAGKIYDEAGRLITLVGDIIKISRLDESSPQIEKTQLDLNVVCQSVADSLNQIAEKNNISLSYNGEQAYIFGSEQIVYEMIYNICDNAVKYNKEHGRVDMTLKCAENNAAVTVVDTGIGIPKDETEHVFERFYRVNKSHSKEIGGTGLGLSIVKHAALFHDAKIDIDSKLGEGTVITVTFPLYNDEREN